MIKDGRQIYRFNNEENLKQAITKNELPIYSLVYTSIPSPRRLKSGETLTI